MADIKFMDLSENDNPATTDSILIGNKDNGLKRTTLGKLGDMFAAHGLFHFEEVRQTLKVNTNPYAIQAPTIKGYKFIFWLQPYTYGCTHAFYVNSPVMPSASVFTGDQITTGDTAGDSYNPHPGVAVVAVYVKEDLA